MLSPLIKQEIALAQDSVHNLINLGQVSFAWRSVCNSDQVWKKHHQEEFKLALSYKESTLLHQGFPLAHKYLCYTVPNGHTLSRSEVLREYKIIEHRLFMLCKTSCSMQAHCIRKEGEEVIFYYTVTSALMDKKEFVNFLYSFSTFTPLITREALPIDYSIFAYEVMVCLYAFLLALFMSPLLFILVFVWKQVNNQWLSG
ncbi:F-box domain-containing protein [Cedratvirus Zaza IHUMI]|uniref:F-box domain-containing protein n=1 Tax=Cedratvirus Zaza IHUMI TaxID=2126979 RepID=A0A2R8FCY2_9VIRU|nr:F-box domain-containing protein [Cedratvirus Zaza IHUMI]